MSPRPFLLVQISDLHIGAEWTEGDPVAALARAVDAVRAFPVRPEAIVVSGDLTEHGGDGEYATVRELLARLPAPAHVLPGNHDERAALRRAFELPGAGAEAVQYAVDLGPLRLLALDTVRPGSGAGELDGERLAWLEAELARAPDRPALIALHHLPLELGIAVWDEIGIPAADRAGLERVVAANPQVLGLVCGHVHRTVVGHLGGRPVMAVPSVYERSKLDFAMAEIELCGDPPAFAVHSLVDGRLVSHLQPY